MGKEKEQGIPGTVILRLDRGIHLLFTYSLIPSASQPFLTYESRVF